MKYYLIAGEASGDLHASRLISSLIKEDSQAEFRFFGGDNMLHAAGDKGTMVRHYRDLAYMGFFPVLLHLPTILSGMKQCKADIMQWQPDCVIFVDYAGFNLNVAKYLRQQINNGNLTTKLYYFIAPKIWAWKEYRIKNFKRDIDEIFSILPFEKAFFENKHHYPIHYVGNPTADEVRDFKSSCAPVGAQAFLLPANGETERGVKTIDKLGARGQEFKGSMVREDYILLLPGSRRQEIKDNLPAMIEASKPFADDYKLIVAGAPGVEPDYYTPFFKDVKGIKIEFGKTYELLSNATAALVTSGTATLETACFNVPQVVCYRTFFPRLIRWAFNHIIKCKYISLVNLIADKEVVKELFADRFSVTAIREELQKILPGTEERENMLDNYKLIRDRLGKECAPNNTAHLIVSLLASSQTH